jgi:hypothetical protein
MAHIAIYSLAHQQMQHLNLQFLESSYDIIETNTSWQKSFSCLLMFHTSDFANLLVFNFRCSFGLYGRRFSP